MNTDTELPSPIGLTTKYALRLKLIPILCRALRVIGVPWERIRKSDTLRKEMLLPQLDLYDAGKSSNHAEHQLSVVFFTMMGSHSFMVATEIALAWALKARGHKVQVVLCDQQLPVCENKTSANRDTWANTCGYCYAFGSKMFTRAGLNVVPVSRLVAGLPESKRAECRGFEKWKNIIESSLFKFFKVGKLKNNEDEAHIADMFQQAAETSAMAATALLESSPDRVIMSHGVYATWAPALKVFSEHKIPVAVYNKAKRRNSAVFNWAVNEMEWDVSVAWASLKDRQLSEHEEQLLDSYLQTRIDHTTDAVKYNFGSRETKAETYERLGLDADREIFVLFTNVLWDAASAQKEIAFPNAVEWVTQTIEWFIAHPEKQLVVKIHPAEIIIGTNQPFASLIREEFPHLPGNIRLIEPEETVNSWSIIEIADLGLVHTSTVGMELPLEGVPCVVVSKTHFRGKGFTIDIDSSEEYFDLLECQTKKSASLTSEAQDLAKKYAFLFFEKYHLPWSFLLEEKYNEYRGFDFRDSTTLFDNSTIRMITQSIESRTEFMNDTEAG